MLNCPKRPSRRWLLSGRISRDGIPLWYSVQRNRRDEIDEPVLDNLMVFERVSDEDTRNHSPHEA